MVAYGPIGRQFLFFIAASVVAGPLLMPTARAAQVACAVATGTGNVEGIDRGGSCEFLGIPYAAPPLGALRWKPPQPAVPWATTLMATTAPGCPSLNAAGTPGGREDCLQLNVWGRDPFPTQPAPVIVWLHTGSFVSASANSLHTTGGAWRKKPARSSSRQTTVWDHWDSCPHALAAEDPAHPASGNYGLLDQRAALEWVRQNIAAFGGNPTRHACGNVGRRRQRGRTWSAGERGPLSSRHHPERDTDDSLAKSCGEGTAGRRLCQRSRVRGPAPLPRACDRGPFNRFCSHCPGHTAGDHRPGRVHRDPAVDGLASRSAAPASPGRPVSSGASHRRFHAGRGAGFIARHFRPA